MNEPERTIAHPGDLASIDQRSIELMSSTPSTARRLVLGPRHWSHPLTDSGIVQFRSDWAAAQAANQGRPTADAASAQV